MLHPSQAVSLCVVKPTSQYLRGKIEGCILGYKEILCLKIFDLLIKWKEHNSWKECHGLKGSVTKTY